MEEVEEDRDDHVSQNHVSRWSKYLDPPEEADPEEDNVLMDRQELHSHNMSDRCETVGHADLPVCHYRCVFRWDRWTLRHKN